ncbi:unnamed protein product [Amoebophrya sp. A25]|nr:unnamed protein product [Amoebophrya sp. A25]|eukprot:GSA25T00009326001.1
MDWVISTCRFREPDGPCFRCLHFDVVAQPEVDSGPPGRSSSSALASPAPAGIETHSRDALPPCRFDIAEFERTVEKHRRCYAQLLEQKRKREEAEVLRAARLKEQEEREAQGRDVEGGNSVLTGATGHDEQQEDSSDEVDEDPSVSVILDNEYYEFASSSMESQTTVAKAPKKKATSVSSLASSNKSKPSSRRNQKSSPSTLGPKKVRTSTVLECLHDVFGRHDDYQEDVDGCYEQEPDMKKLEEDQTTEDSPLTSTTTASSPSSARLRSTATSSSTYKQEEEAYHAYNDLLDSPQAPLELETALEQIEGEIGAVLWRDACDHFLDFLAKFLPSWHGRSAIELGAGSGYIGFALAADGASDVCVTDLEMITPQLKIGEYLNLMWDGRFFTTTNSSNTNGKMNKARPAQPVSSAQSSLTTSTTIRQTNIRACPCDWVLEQVPSGTFEFVICCEVLYAGRDVWPGLKATLKKLAKQSEGTFIAVLLAVNLRVGRTDIDAFLELLGDDVFPCVKRLSTFGGTQASSNVHSESASSASKSLTDFGVEIYSFSHRPIELDENGRFIE